MLLISHAYWKYYSSTSNEFILHTKLEITYRFGNIVGMEMKRSKRIKSSTNTNN